MMTKHEMENLAQKQLEAYNQRDLELFCSCYDEDVTITLLISNRITCQGKDNFKQIYKKLFESSPNLHCTLRSRIILDNSVIDEEILTGHARDPNGKIHAVAIYGFANGLINRVWFPK